MHRLSTPLALSFTALLAASAGASTITVSKTGALTTIQSGVDAASAGDTVKVKTGVYQENVTIGVAKGGLRLVADGAVVVDARPSGGLGGGPGIAVAADGVKISGITVRNATNASGPPDGSGIRVTGDDFLAQNCTTLGCDPAGFELNGVAGARFKKCVARGDGNGFSFIDSSGIVLTKCSIRGSDRGGVEFANCAGLTMRACRIFGTDAEGVASSQGTNSDITLSKCRFEMCEDSTVNLDGNDAAIDGVEVVGCRFLTNSAGLSFDNVLDLRLRANRIERVDDDNNGLSVSNCSRVVIEGNRFKATAITPIACAGGSQIVIRGNDLRDCLYSADPAIGCETDGARIENNRVRGSVGPGLQINGDDSEVFDNVILNGLDDGIFVTTNANGALLIGNVVRRCLAEGLDHRGTNSVIRDNAFSKCRLDLTNDGTAQFKNNKFKTGGENVPHEID